MRLIPRTSTLLMAAALLLPVSMFASSHREAPGSLKVPSLDLTDVYVFRSPDAPTTMTIVVNSYPFNEPGGGPNFFPFSDDGLYEIHIDNNGDAKEDITYQFKFRSVTRNPNTFLYATGPITALDDPDFNRPQFYTVTRITGPRRSGASSVLGSDLPTPPANIGPKSTPNYAALSDAAVRTLSDGVKVFAGQADDAFFVDLGGIFDLATLRPLANLHKVAPIAAAAETPVDGLRGYNVNTIAIQVPISAVTTSAANSIIGVWATTSAPRFILNSGGTQQPLGGFSQVSRLGTPLVNEVVIPLGLKDAFNGLEPSMDAGLYGSNATFKAAVDDPELAKLYELLYGIPKIATPRADIFAAALTGLDGLNKPANVVPAEMLRVNLATPVTAAPNPLGALAADNQGFPNGRRLADDVTDILLKVFAGVLVPGNNVAPRNLLTDGIGANDKTFRGTFPYVALPHEGKASVPHATTQP